MRLTLLSNVFLAAVTAAFLLAGGAALRAQTLSSTNFSSNDTTTGGGFGEAASAGFLTVVMSGGSADASGATSTNFRNSTGTIFSLPGAGTNVNSWLGRFGGNPLDARNWTQGVPSAAAFANILEIGPNANSPVLLSGTLSGMDIIIREGGILSVTGTGVLELGAASNPGSLLIETGGRLDLTGTATVRAANASQRMSFIAMGDLTVDGTATGSGMGVKISDVDSAGVQLQGTGLLTLVNLEIVNGAAGGVLLDYARADSRIVDGIVFPDTSFSPGGFNVRASGGGNLTINIDNLSSGGSGWGESFDDDLNGQVNWTIGTPPAANPTLLVENGSAQPGAYVAINNAQGIVLGMWRITAKEGTGKVGGVTFAASGTADESTAVKRLRLFRDINANGVREATDPEVGVAVSVFSNDGPVSFSFVAPDQMPEDRMRLLLVADLTGSGTQGTTLQYSIGASGVVSLPATGASASLPVTGAFPVDGTDVTLGTAAAPRLGALTLTDSTALVGETGVTGTVTISNTGSNPLDLSGAQVTALPLNDSNQLPTTLTTNPTFNPSQIAPGEAGTIDLDFDIPGTLSPGLYILDVQVMGDDSVLSISVSDLAASTTASIMIVGSLSITTTALPEGTSGSAYGALVTVDGGLAPVVVSLTSGNLPDGITEAGGLLTGIPTVDGSFPLTFSASDAASQNTSVNLTLVIAPPPAGSGGSGGTGGDAGSGYTQNASIFSQFIKNGVIGEDYSASLSGAPDGGTWSLDSGTLPAGLTLSSVGNITGVPTAAGSASFVVRFDVGASFATQPLGIEIFDPAAAAPPPAAASFGGASGMNVLATVVSGAVVDMLGADVTAADVDNDPLLNFVDIDSEDVTGPILIDALYFDVNASGTVDEGDVVRGRMDEALLLAFAGISDVSLNSGSLGSGATLRTGTTVRNFDVVLGSNPSINVGTAQLRITASANIEDLAGNLAQVSSATIIDSQTVSAGIELVTLNGEVIEEFGTVNIDWQTRPSNHAWTIDIDLYQNAALLQNIASALPDSGRYEWTVPGGLLGTGYEIVLTGNNATLSQIFTDQSTATFDVVQSGNSGSPGLSGRLARAGVPSTGDLAPEVLRIPDIADMTRVAEVGLDYNTALTAAGGRAPYQWTVAAGRLPNGLALSTDGAVTGTPAASGVSTVVYQVNDATGQSARRAVTMRVFDALNIASVRAPAGKLGEYCNIAVNAIGGSYVYTWRVAGGELPQGLALTSDGAFANVSGVPAISGTFRVTLEVHDSLGAVRATMLTMNVLADTGLVGVHGGKLVEIDAQGETITPISGNGLGEFSTINALAYDNTNGVLYGHDARTGTVVAIDTVTGTASPIGMTGYADIRALTFGRGVLYAIAGDAGTLLTVNTATGTAKPHEPAVAIPGAFALTWEKQDDVLDVASCPQDRNGTTFWRVNWQSGTVGQTASTDSCVGSIAWDATENRLVFLDRAGRNLPTIGLGCRGDQFDTNICSIDCGEWPLPSPTDSLIVQSVLGNMGFPLTCMALDGDTLYGVSNGCLVRSSLADIRGQSIGGMALYNIGNLAWDSDAGVVYATKEGQLYAISDRTGEARFIGQPDGVPGLKTLTFDSTARVLYATSHNGALYRIDPSTGTSMFVPSNEEPKVALAYDKRSDLMLSLDGEGCHLQKFDLVNGAVISETTLDVGELPLLKLALHASGTLYALDVTTALFRVDTTSGALTPCGMTGFAAIAGK